MTPDEAKRRAAAVLRPWYLDDDRDPMLKDRLGSVIAAAILAADTEATEREKERCYEAATYEREAHSSAISGSKEAYEAADRIVEAIRGPAAPAKPDVARYVEALRPLAALNREQDPEYLLLMDRNGTLHCTGLETLTMGHARAAARLVEEWDAKGGAK